MLADSHETTKKFFGKDDKKKKKNNCIKKWAKNLHRHLSKEYFQMANKHTKRSSAILTIVCC